MTARRANAEPGGASPWRSRIVGHGKEQPDALVANPGNWRVHPKRQQAALAEVLDRVGWVQEVIVNRRTGRLVDGHLRVELALARGDRRIPVSYVDLAEDEEALILATLDPLAGLATADPERLAELLHGLNVDGTALQEMLARLADSAGIVLGEEPPVNEVPAPIERAAELRRKWQTKPGQLWRIPSLSVKGKAHRLLCGDSTSPTDVKRLMAGQRAGLFATDPPYLVDYDGTNHPSKLGQRDTKNKDWSGSYQDWDRSEQGEELYEGFIAAAIAHAITPDAAWYCWHASRRRAMVEAVWVRHEAFVHQEIVWVKDRAILTRSWYLWQHEPCMFGWVKGQKPRRVARDFLPSVWNVPTVPVGTSGDHPTIKPVEVFAIPIRQHTRKGELCYEPFAGSGTQIVAAEQLGRVCYALELAPEFVAVTLERLSSMGLKPKPAGKA